MKRLLKNYRLYFVITTAVAAFLHNAWTISVFFGGNQPAVTSPLVALPDFISQVGALIWWLIPGVLVSYSLDIGLIATAEELTRVPHLPDKKRWRAYLGLGITFAVLAVAMWVLQFLFLILHVPALPLAAGVRAEWVEDITRFRDAAIFVIPLLMPVSVMLYTFSSSVAAPETEHTTRNERRAQLDADMGIVEPVAVSSNGRGEKPKSEAAPFPGNRITEGVKRLTGHDGRLGRA